MSFICETFKLYGENKIEAHYDIRQMIETLKIHNWRNIPPYNFYLTPLHNDLEKVRGELADMHKKGPLFMAYIIENNKDLRDKINDMLKSDQKAQLLVGNTLKQDQFKFLYDTMKIIYDSVLRVQLINGDDKLKNEVLPALVAYKSVLHIRNI